MSTRPRTAPSAPGSGLWPSGGPASESAASTWLVRREGWAINHKRVERLYRAEGLALRQKRRRSKATDLRSPLPTPERPNQCWSMDFVADRLSSGRQVRALTLVDDYSRECPAIEVDTSLPGTRVVQVLERLAAERGLPQIIRVDNGPEFASRALDACAYRRGVRLHFIRPGKPTENAYVESVNGHLRDECLNTHWFATLAEARDLIEVWRQAYNPVRPHSALGYLTPEEFAGRNADKAGGQLAGGLTCAVA